MTLNHTELGRAVTFMKYLASVVSLIVHDLEPKKLDV